MKKNLSLTLTVLAIALFIIYFLLNIDKFKALMNVNGYILLIIAGLNLSGIFMNGIFMKIILVPFRQFISTKESFYVSLISSVGNFFAPVGAGFGFRAVYLKKKYNLPYSEYISTLAGNYIIVFLVNSFFGLLALYMLRERANAQSTILALVFSCVFLTSLALTLVKIPIKNDGTVKNKYFRPFVKNMYHITHGWDKITSAEGLLLRLTAITAVNFAITIAIMWMIVQALHFEISFAPLLLFSVLGSLSLFINITPANLGIKEAIYLFSASVLGFSTSQILSIALIDRGVLFIVLFALWFVSPKLKNRQLAEMS